MFMLKSKNICGGKYILTSSWSCWYTYIHPQTHVWMYKPAGLYKGWSNYPERATAEHFGYGIK